MPRFSIGELLFFAINKYFVDRYIETIQIIKFLIKLLIYSSYFYQHGFMLSCLFHKLKSIYIICQLFYCLVAKSCPTLCDPMDCSLPGSSLHGIFQARMSSRSSPEDLSNPRLDPCLLHWQADSLPLSHQESPDCVCCPIL